jgi:hypothetical protein
MVFLNYQFLLGIQSLQAQQLHLLHLQPRLLRQLQKQVAVERKLREYPQHLLYQQQGTVVEMGAVLLVGLLGVQQQVGLREQALVGDKALVKQHKVLVVL